MTNSEGFVKPASSIDAKRTWSAITSLQKLFVKRLDSLSARFGDDERAQAIEWLRVQGACGGGKRYVLQDRALFDRGSVNISQVHYEEIDDKPLESATAISTIIHPKHPLLPSLHMHISWTKRKDTRGYWRIMADLNPSHEDLSETATFQKALQEVSGKLYAHGSAQGDRYFFIPALGRTRGVKHFYLENYHGGDFDNDLVFATTFGETVIETYTELLRQKLQTQLKTPTGREVHTQLAYHTLYFFQVLTLDRGTTAGLLVHDENDLGILASLPSRVDVRLLRAWKANLPAPQDVLLEAILCTLGNQEVATIGDETKLALAQALRAFYRSYPEAMALQAKGDTTPPTLSNHTGKIEVLPTKG